MPSAVARHPSTVRMFQQAAQRWTALKRQHDAHCRIHWLGVMLTQFTDTELILLAEYLSESDRALLRSVTKR